jgi:hypothetical protein
MEFNWSVNKVKVAENNLITQVQLTVTATDGDVTASQSHVCELTQGDTFIPYGQLTEQQVLEWCFEPNTVTWTDASGEHSVTRLIKDEGETQVANQIARQLAQRESEPALPWAEVAQPE